jgi:transmembrane sensor
MVREVVSEKRLTAMSPEEAAAFWTTRHSEGLFASEEEQFKDWLARSEQNANAWADAQAAWSVFDEAGNDEILSAMRSHALQTERSYASWYNPQLAAAAAFALLMLTSMLLLIPDMLGGGVPSGQEAAAPPVIYASAKGEVKVVALPDGSRATLDAESSVETRFTDNSRSLRLLRGRAFFDAAHDPRKPFTVSVRDRQILAVGTRFDVRLEPGELTVTLVEGSVKITATGMVGEKILAPGQQFIERDGIARVRSEATSVEEALGWQQGYVTFDNDTLADAVTEINRYSTRQLTVRDEAVAAMRVSGRFRSGDAERFGRTVAEIHPLNVVQRSTGSFELVPRRSAKN